MLSLVELEVDMLVRQPKFFENNGDFPKNQVSFQTAVTLGMAGVNVPAVGSGLVVVQGELFSVRHDELATLGLGEVEWEG